MKMLSKPLFTLNRDGEVYKANLNGEIDLPEHLVELGRLYGLKEANKPDALPPTINKI